MSNKFQKELKIFSRKQKIEVKKELIDELFSNVITFFDSQKILNFSINYQIPLTVVDSNGDSLIHKILNDDNCRQNELNKLNFIKFLVNQGVGPDSPNVDNIKPIHIACKKQLSNIINYFLEIGIDINYPDNFGNTPLHYFLNGNLYDYVNLTPIELIQPKEYKPNELSFEEKVSLEKFIWNNHITQNNNDTDLRFFKNTIEKILLNEPTLLAKYNETLMTINDSKDDKSIISDIKSKHADIINYIKNKFNKFTEISELEIHDEEFNSWRKGNPSGLSILKNIGGSEYPIQDYLKEKITENVDILKNMFDNENLFSNPFGQDVHLPTRVSRGSSQIIQSITNSDSQIFNLDGTINQEYVNDRNSVFNKKLTNLNSYIGDLILSDGSLIGGARTLDIVFPYGYNNDNYWDTKKNYLQINQGQRGGGPNIDPLMNDDIFVDVRNLSNLQLELLHLHKKMNSVVDNNVKLNYVESIIRCFEKLEINESENKNKWSYLIESIFEDLKFPYIDILPINESKMINRPFPKYNNSQTNSSNDIKLLQFKIGKINEDIKKIEKEQSDKEKEFLEEIKESVNIKDAIDIANDRINDNEEQLIITNNLLFEKQQELLKENQDKFTNKKYPDLLARINEKNIPEKGNKTDFDNEISVLRKRNEQLNNANESIDIKLNEYEVNISNFNCDGAKIDLDINLIDQLKAKEEQRNNINKQILSQKESNEETKKHLLEMEKTLNQEREDNRLEMQKVNTKKSELGMKEFILSTKEKEATLREEEATRKINDLDKKIKETEQQKSKLESEREVANQARSRFESQIADSTERGLKVFEQEKKIHDLDSEILKLRVEKSDLESEKLNLQEENWKLEDDMYELQNSYDSLKDDFENNLSISQNQKEEIDDLKKKLEEDKKTIEYKQNNYEFVLNQVMQKMKIIDELQNEKEDLEKEKTDLESEINETKQKYESELTGYAEASRGTLENLTNLQKYYGELEQRYQQKSKDLENLKNVAEFDESENITLQQELTVLKNEYGVKEQEIESLENENSMLIGSNEELKRNLDELNKVSELYIEALDKKVDELEKVKSKLEEENKNLGETINTNSGLQADYVEKKEEDIKNISQDLKYYKTSLALLKLEYGELKEEKKRSDENTIKILDEKDDFENQISELTELFADDEEFIALLMNKNKTYEEMVELLNSKIASLESTVEDKDKQIYELKNKLKAKKGKAIKKRKKLIRTIIPKTSDKPAFVPAGKASFSKGTEYNKLALESNRNREDALSSSGSSRSQRSDKSDETKSNETKSNETKSNESDSDSLLNELDELNSGMDFFDDYSDAAGSEEEIREANEKQAKEKQVEELQKQINDFQPEKVEIENKSRFGLANDQDRSRLDEINAEIRRLEKEIYNINNNLTGGAPNDLGEQLNKLNDEISELKKEKILREYKLNTICDLIEKYKLNSSEIFNNYEKIRKLERALEDINEAIFYNRQLESDRINARNMLEEKEEKFNKRKNEKIKSIEKEIFVLKNEIEKFKKENIEYKEEKEDLIKKVDDDKLNTDDKYLDELTKKINEMDQERNKLYSKLGLLDYTIDEDNYDDIFNLINNIIDEYIDIELSSTPFDENYKKTMKEIIFGEDINQEGGGQRRKFTSKIYEEIKKRLLANGYQLGNSGLEIANFNVDNLYNIAMHINRINIANTHLCMNQVLKTFYISEIINNNSKIIYWIWILLSDLIFYNFALNQDFNNLPYSNDKHRSIIDLARNIFLGEQNVLILDWLNKDFTDDIEKLVFAITLYVENYMTQKPILSHVADTIFILRKYRNDNNLINMRNGKLESLHLNPDLIPNYLNNPDNNFMERWVVDTPFDVNKTDHLVEVLPSRLKFFINYKNLNNDNDKRFYMKKLFESYILGYDFLGCFPKLNMNEPGNKLKIVHNPRSNEHLNGDRNSFRDEDHYYDNHGFFSNIFNDFINYYHDRIEILQRRVDSLDNEINGLGPNDSRIVQLIQQRNNAVQESQFLNIGGAHIFGINNLRNDHRNLIIDNDYVMITNDEEYSHYRISNSRGLSNFVNDMKNNITSYYKKCLIGEYPYFSVYEEILKLESSGSESFEKIFSHEYPNLLTLDDLCEEYGQFKKQLIENQIVKDDLPERTKDNLNNIFNFKSVFDLKSFDKNLNDINSLYFIYYYFAYGGDLFKIPKFNYYKIPISRENKFKLYTSDENLKQIPFGQQPPQGQIEPQEEFDYGINYVDQEGGAESPEGFIHQNDVTSYRRFLNGILNGNKYITPAEIEREIILSKNESLIPPSLEDNLYEFYKLSVINLIINVSENTLDDLRRNPPMDDILNKISNSYNIEANQERIVLWYYVAKKLEEIMSRYFNELIDFSANSIFRNFINGRTKFSDVEELGFINNDTANFNFSLTSLNLDKEQYEELSGKLNSSIFGNILFPRFALDLYNITEDYDETRDECGRETKNDFIIYSNEYTTTDLTKNLQKISIDVDILEKLLIYGAKLFISNKENKMPVFKILNHYNYSILQKLCGKGANEFGINYNYTGFKNYDNPISFLTDSLNNHGSKLINNNTRIDKIFKSFSHNCFQEINILLTSSNNFGYNILKNLKFSYQMVSYIFNQYLCTYLYNIKDNNRRPGDREYNFMTNYANIPVNNSDLAVNELRVEINNYIEKNNSKLNNLGVSNNNHKGSIIRGINNENTELRRILNTLWNFQNNGVNTRINIENNHEIIENYESIITIFNGERGPFIEAWKKFLDNINDFTQIPDDSLALIRAVKKSMDTVDPRILDACQNLLGNISDFSEEYFKEHKYTDVNETLLFINKLLIFMTKNIICMGIEIFTRKLLIKYLLQKFPDQDFNFYIEKIDSLFNTRVIRKVTLTEYLYNEISERLVKNVSNIYKNRDDEVSHSLESVEDILSEFIGVVQTNGIINISDEDMIIKILKRDVLKYFSLITPLVIKNWQVTCENYMRFYINHYRISKCKKILLTP